jgi:hypothetical protein
LIRALSQIFQGIVMKNKRRRRKAKAITSAICLFAATAGCTSFQETYYVGMFDPAPTTQPSGSGTSLEGPMPTQFYKYEISGSSFASDTQFASGLYDSRSVDRLLGEVRLSTTLTVASSNAATPLPSAPASAMSAYVDCSLPSGIPNADWTTRFPVFEIDKAEIDIQAGAPPTLPLTKVSQIQATGITLTSATTLTLNGITSAIASADNTASYAAMRLEIKGGVTLAAQATFSPTATMVMQNANALIVSNAPTSVNNNWQGQFQNASSDATNGRLLWTGNVNSNFAAQGGTFDQASKMLQLNGGVATFNGISSLSQPAGADILASNGSFQLNGTCSLTVASVSSTSGTLTFTAANAPKITIGSKTLSDLVAAANTKFPYVVSGLITLDQPTDVTTGAAVAMVPVNSFSAERLALNAGSFHLTVQPSAPSSAQANTKGSAAVAQQNTQDILVPDAHRHIFVRFGPEGTSIAQSDSERMVIFMSSDPQALTDRIDAMVNTMQTQSTIAAVIAQPRLNEQTQAIQSAQFDLSVASMQSTSFLTQVNTAPADAATLKSMTQQFIQSLDAGE